MSTSFFMHLLTRVLIPSSPPLRSLSFRLNDRQLLIPEAWIECIVNTFGDTIRKLSLGDCKVLMASVRRICDKCVHLEVLEIPVPVDETVSRLILPNGTSATPDNNNGCSGHSRWPSNLPTRCIHSSISPTRTPHIIQRSWSRRIILNLWWRLSKH